MHENLWVLYNMVIQVVQGRLSKFTNLSHEIFVIYSTVMLLVQGRYSEPRLYVLLLYEHLDYPNG